MLPDRGLCKVIGTLEYIKMKDWKVLNLVNLSLTVQQIP